MWVEAHLESLKLCVFLVRNPRGSAPFTVHNRQETDQTTEPEERRRQPLTVLRLGSRRRQFSVGDNDPSHSFPTPRDITILKSPKVKQTMINSNTAKRLLASLRNSYTQWLVLFLKDEVFDAHNYSDISGAGARKQLKVKLELKQTEHIVYLKLASQVF